MVKVHVDCLFKYVEITFSDGCVLRISYDSILIDGLKYGDENG